MIPQQLIDDFKRERCALALSRAAHEVGPHQVTVALIVKRAKIARATFYSLFDDVGGAFRWTWKFGEGRLQKAAADAAEEEDRGEERLQATVSALLAAVEEHPELSEFCLVHAWARADSASGAPAGAVIEVLAAAIASGREGDVGAKRAGPLEELLACSIVSQIETRLRRGEVGSRSVDL